MSGDLLRRGASEIERLTYDLTRHLTIVVYEENICGISGAVFFNSKVAIPVDGLIEIVDQLLAVDLTRGRRGVCGSLVRRAETAQADAYEKDADNGTYFWESNDDVPKVTFEVGAITSLARPGHVVSRVLRNNPRGSEHEHR